MNHKELKCTQIPLSDPGDRESLYKHEEIDRNHKIHEVYTWSYLPIPTHRHRQNLYVKAYRTWSQSRV